MIADDWRQRDDDEKLAKFMQREGRRRTVMRHQ
jgi:hypothetical protein